MNQYIELYLKNHQIEKAEIIHTRDKGDMIGLSAPDMRKIAKEMVKDPAVCLDFFHEKHMLFEEFDIHAYALGYLKQEISSILHYTEQFIPQINCWSVCDSLCQNFTHAKKYPREVFDFVKQYQHSKIVWEQRFVAVMFQCKFMRQDYIDEVLKILETIEPKEYYAKMGIAWATATAMAKCPDETMAFMKKCRFDDETYQMAVKKIIESYRTREEDKSLLMKMKRQ